MEKKHEIDREPSDLSYLREDYKVKEKIGSGTYGDVYRVKHRTTKKEYAVKYIKDFMKNDAYAQSALREVTIMRKFS